MIVVDSSVWVDYFRGINNKKTDALDERLGVLPLAIGDLILTEVLQGFIPEPEFNNARRLLESFEIVTLGGPDIAVAAARNYRKLRSKGVTIRKTIDTIIATRCIRDGHVLLHNDRDFDAFQKHLGLKCLA